jgi:hypothetical protein
MRTFYALLAAVGMVWVWGGCIVIKAPERITVPPPPYIHVPPPPPPQQPPPPTTAPSGR